MCVCVCVCVCVANVEMLSNVLITILIYYNTYIDN